MHQDDVFAQLDGRPQLKLMSAFKEGGLKLPVAAEGAEGQGQEDLITHLHVGPFHDTGTQEE